MSTTLPVVLAVALVGLVVLAIVVWRLESSYYREPPDGRGR